MKAERLGLRAGDGVIYAVLVLLCAALFLLPLLSGTKDNLTVQIIADGQTAQTVALSSVQTEEMHTVNGCVIVVTPDSVFVKEADCPDRLCVRTGTISRAGETIACVPNRVVVTLRQTKTTNKAIDGVAY